MNRKKFYVSISLFLTIVVCTLFFSIASCAQTRPTLYWGSQGSNVREVQQLLSNWGYYDGPVDGIYGATTQKAVTYFQRKNGLPADGIVGAQTYNALGLSTGPAPSTPAAGYQPTTGVSAGGDIMLLARAIFAEAEAEPYIGKVSVGAVLLNRVGSASFPQSLSGVIYQSHALESVTNGRVNTQPNDDSVRAARDAINGWDPTYGCLYFWNPSKPVNAWIWTRKIIVQYGAHVFAK